MVRRAKCFRRLTYKDETISTKTATCIYKSICRPVLDYGRVILANAPASTKRLLNIAETSALRSITKIRHPNNPLYNPSNNMLYEKCEIEKIEDRQDRLVKKFAANTNNFEITKKLILQKNNYPVRSTPKHPQWSLFEHLHNIWITLYFFKKSIQK